jgi:hypothetical protein
MAHMYIHHISITIHSSFLHIFHPSWQAGFTQFIASATVRIGRTANFKHLVNQVTQQYSTPQTIIGLDHE